MTSGGYQKSALSYSCITFCIDDNDKITHVNNQWDLYAVNNRANSLASPNIIGMSLWDFIHGDEVKKLYADILDSVRRKKKPSLFPTAAIPNWKNNT